MNGRKVALAGVAVAAVVALAVLGPWRWASAGGSLGDVNCDGTVNSIDAALILQFNAGLITSLACQFAADVNGDGTINSIDAALILQFEAGLVDTLGAQAVAVSLDEFAVVADPSTVAEGTVVFRTENDGTILHNLKVVKTDLAPDALPVIEDEFIVDETQLDVVASTSDLNAGESEDVTVDLEAGSYVLICNIPSHYQAGTFTGFTVE